ncbi:MAG TPA: SMI1/KNR4 family protein [Chlamydiales bacterium]|nr:SMI1/KNR4 family protein [Chlamydiales bacterium]
MNPLAKKYYEIGGDSNIQEVLFLCEEKNLDWSTILEKNPDIPRGWFELSRITPEERIEFVSDSWANRLPFHPIAERAFSHFFSRLDDIAIVIVKRNADVFAEMVYSFADNRSFFRGLPPAVEEDVRMFKSEIGARVPFDYQSFLRLHNGFGKLSEIEIIPMEEVFAAREIVRKLVDDPAHAIDWQNHGVDPDSLIPFFEDFGLNSFQCFFSDWYPYSDMGNVYLSGIHYTLSDTSDRSRWQEQLAFPNFLEWLAYYLEGMNVSK